MSEATEQKFHIKYDSMTAVFADHVVLNGANGAFILDFASTIVSDPNAGQATIPVHTRVAMTHQGAAQLPQLLSNAFSQGAKKGAASGAAPGAGQSAAPDAGSARPAAAAGSQPQGQRPAQGASQQSSAQRPAQGGSSGPGAGGAR